MKKIFLIGDSIRLGYQAKLSEELSDCASILASSDNARFTTYTIRYLHEWVQSVARGEDVHLVHWNNGLWDACHWHGDPLALVPLETYASNLVRIHSIIRKLLPNATIVFASTTSVGQNHPRIYNQEIVAMNEIAKEVLSPLGVQFNDLHATLGNRLDYLCSDATHFTENGYAFLAHACALEIRKYL